MSTLITQLLKLIDAQGENPQLQREINTLLQSWDSHEQATLLTPVKTVTHAIDSNTTQTSWNSEDNGDESQSKLTTHFNQTTYEVIGTLGVGGMGRVLKVYDSRLKRNLAMKILHPAMMEYPQIIARFTEEAQLLAQMQHPNIVPIHDVGTLKDGRLFFTMKEIQGKPLNVHIRAVHAAIQDNQWQTTASGWSLRRLMEVFRQCCDTIAYSHSLGVIHRDLKPENILLGEFGEVQVSDWGIAKLIADLRADKAIQNDKLIKSDRYRDGDNATLIGTVTGTPAYMPPEQAKGEIEEIDHRSDIYSLGAILYQILMGKRPYSEVSYEDTLSKVLAGPPQSLRAISLKRERGIGLDNQSKEAKLPLVLINACEKAMARDKKQRFQSAAELGKIIGDWLDGVQKRDEALGFVEKAAETGLEKNLKEIIAAEKHAIAKEGLQDIPAWEGESVKGNWWKIEVEAQQAIKEAKRLDVLRIQQLYAALAVKGDLPEAHNALANLYREKHIAAEKGLDEDAALNTELRLREHLNQLPANYPDKQSHFNYLKGSGSLSLSVTEPAEVVLERYLPHHRRLVPKTIAHLGSGPIEAHSLEMGSYRLRFKRNDHPDVLYPVYIGRGEHWNCTDPSGVQQSIWLPPLHELKDDECFIAGGWFQAGGDPTAPGALAAKRVWLNSFSMRRFQITNAEYLIFLNDLIDKGRKEEALRYAPRERVGESDQLGALVYAQNKTGHFSLAKTGKDDEWQPDWPVMMVDWYSCQAYAEWLSAQTGQAWRLPTELEWEKAGRGVDGRIHSWGNGFDPSYCCLGPSHKDKRSPVSIHRYPTDESVYGVRGMSGNVVDWTASMWAPTWEDMDTLKTDDDKALRVYRGGGWYGVPWFARLAYRYWYDPAKRLDVLGFRLCRNL